MKPPRRRRVERRATFDVDRSVRRTATTRGGVPPSGGDRRVARTSSRVGGRDLHKHGSRSIASVTSPRSGQRVRLASSRRRRGGFPAHGFSSVPVTMSGARDRRRATGCRSRLRAAPVVHLREGLRAGVYAPVRSARLYEDSRGAGHRRGSHGQASKKSHPGLLPSSLVDRRAERANPGRSSGSRRVDREADRPACEGRHTSRRPRFPGDRCVRRSSDGSRPTRRNCATRRRISGGPRPMRSHTPGAEGCAGSSGRPVDVVVVWPAIGGETSGNGDGLSVERPDEAATVRFVARSSAPLGSYSTSGLAT